MLRKHHQQSQTIIMFLVGIDASRMCEAVSYRRPCGSLFTRKESVCVFRPCPILYFFQVGVFLFLRCACTKWAVFCLLPHDHWQLGEFGWVQGYLRLIRVVVISRLEHETKRLILSQGNVRRLAHQWHQQFQVWISVGLSWYALRFQFAVVFLLHLVHLSLLHL